MGKLALKNINKAMTTEAAAEAFADLLERGLARTLGGDVTGTAVSARLIAYRLGELRGAIEAANEALERIHDMMSRHRRRRDEACEKLYNYVRDVRKLSRSFFGRARGDDFLGLHGPKPRDPEKLHLDAGRVLTSLADATWPVPEVLSDGAKMTPEKVAKRIAALHKKLGEENKALTAGETQEALAQAAHTRAERAFDVFHGRGGRYLEAALNLAGLDDLAAQVRPGVGRIGRPPKAETVAAAQAALAAGAKGREAGDPGADLLLESGEELVVDDDADGEEP